MLFFNEVEGGVTVVQVNNASGDPSLVAAGYVISWGYHVNIPVVPVKVNEECPYRIYVPGYKVIY